MRLASISLAVFTAILVTTCTSKKATKNDNNPENDQTPISTIYAENDLKLGITLTGSSGISITFFDSAAGSLTTTADGTYYLPNSITDGQSFDLVVTESEKSIYCQASILSGNFTISLVLAIDCKDASAPSHFDYNISEYVFLNGYDGMSLGVPSASGRIGASYSISPPLPDGMNLDSETGIISGTPQSTFAKATYTITQTGYDDTIMSDQVDLYAMDGYLVDSFEDLNDADTGNSVCFATGATGPTGCTLRAAIEQASDSGAHQLVVFDGLHQLDLAKGELLADNQSITIVGLSKATAIIDFNHQDRILNYSHAAGTLTLKNMTIREAGDPGANGSGLRITTATDVFISNVSFLENRTTVNDGAAIQGDPSNHFDVEYTDFIDNYAGSDDAAVWIHGVSTSSYRNSYFYSNEALIQGAALSISGGGTHEIRDCYFLDNNVIGSGIGGAVFALGSSVVNVWNTTFEGNSTAGEGAAVYSQDTSTINVRNSTFNGNTAGNVGGAAYTRAGGANQINVYNSAFIDNSATNGGGAFANESGTGTNVVENSYFRNNTGSGGSVDTFYFTSGTHNHSDNVYDELDVVSGPDVDTNATVESDFQLGSYDLHGGLVKTWSLLADSPMIDIGNNGNCPSTDYKGTTRPLDGDNDTNLDCDIGPFEYSP